MSRGVEMQKYKLFGIIALVIVITVIIFGSWYFLRLENAGGTGGIEVIPQESKKEAEVHAFTPKEIQPGSKSDYDMKLAMNKDGLFTADVKITITNTSDETWSDVKFYFIPNMFTATTSPNIEKPVKIDIKSVKIDNTHMKYTLEEDTLHIPLQEEVPQSKSVIFQMNYQFTMSETMGRFTEFNQNFYLAHWYPMVPTYRNGWNKQPYNELGESYHTPFSKFKLEYDIPEGYTIMTTGENSFPSGKKNVIHAENVKEFYVGVMKKPQVVQRDVENVKIRLFGIKESEEMLEKMLTIATDALTYFSRTIGPYPHNQLDIILDGPGMEYPGIVTVGASDGKEEYIRETIVHEIAHQWFYGVVTNDPYFHAWLDEGITSFATNLFFLPEGEQELMYKDLFGIPEQMPSNLPLRDYDRGTSVNSIYRQASMKLATIFNEQGGKEKAEQFLKEYVRLYSYKEVDTAEFVRFMKFYLNVEDDLLFKDWLKLDGN
jgi:hypothetical protein